MGKKNRREAGCWLRSIAAPRRAGSLAAVLAALAMLGGATPAWAQQAPQAYPQAYPQPYPQAYPQAYPQPYPQAAPPAQRVAIPLPPAPGTRSQPQSLEQYDTEIATAKYELREAKGRGDDAAADRWKEEYASLRRGRKAFVDRTTERTSTGMMVTGIVLTPLGAAAVVTGVALMSVAALDGVDRRVRSRFETAGLVTAISGTVLVGAGIPLWILGSKRVPRGTALVVRPTEVALRGTF